MQMVSDMERERMFTFRLTLENRRGEEREFEEATRVKRNDDGTKTVAYFPSDGDGIREQTTEDFGRDWQVVETVGMNVPRSEQSA